MIILQQTRGNLSSGDQLALDLPFAETKSLAARIGPTPIFSRASGATYVGSDGLIHGIDTSTSSNSISAGSKSFTLTATAGQDQLWRTGDAVEAANGTNWMFGTVTSYDANTQVLVCNMTSISGTGTFTSWRIGYRGPRFDHATVSPFACRGLLIEEGGRTNYLVHSQDFQNWSAGNVVSRNKELTIADPSGGFTANRIVGNSAASVYRDPVNGVPVGNRSNSIYARAVTGGVNMIEIAGTGIFVRVNLETGSLITSSGVVAGSVVIQPIGSIGPDGYTWYRISAVPTSTTLASMYLSPNPTVFTGDRDLFLLWGAQLEAGSFPTSYIPTTTSTAARAADVCSVTTADWSNAGNDTMLASYFVRQAISGAIVVEGSPSVSWMSISFNPSGGQRGIYRHGGTASRLDASSNSAYSLTGLNKIALTSGEQICLNGSLAQTVIADPAQADISTSLSIGSRGNGASTFLNGHIAAIRYYRKRLPNAKLQALTA